MRQQLPFQESVYFRNKAGNTMIKISGFRIQKAFYLEDRSRIACSLDENRITDQDLDQILEVYEPIPKEEFVALVAKIRKQTATSYFRLAPPKR
jgi:hypothetical protein